MRLDRFASTAFWGVAIVVGIPFAGANEPVLGQDLAIWQVQSQQNTVYLLGSVHVGKKCELRSQRVQTVLEDVEVAVFEIDFDVLTADNQLKAGLAILEKARLQHGDQPLKAILDTKTYTTLGQRFEELKPPGLPMTLNDLNKSYRPWYIALQMVGFALLKDGLKPECGVDRLLAQKAQAAGKEITGLETLEYQSDLIANALAAASAQEINTFFRTLLAEETSKSASLLIGSVASGKVETLERIVAESCKDTVEICNQLLGNRNKNWLTQIKSFLGQTQDYLVVVGAGHFVGDDGLLKLLEREGYTIERF